MQAMTESIKREFIEKAAEIGIDLNDKMLSSFDLYYKNLLEWNAVMNLTAITEEKDVFEKHFLDSLTITKIVSRETLDKGCTLMDLGTGAGFPGLPIAIVFPNIQVVLVDSLNKRIRFLEDTVQKLGLSNVTCIHARAEELSRNKKYREKMDICCSRAVANLSTLSEYCLPFVKKGGYFISYKTEQVQSEIDQGKNAIKVLGGGNVQVEFFTLPGTDYHRRKSLLGNLREGGTPTAHKDVSFVGIHSNLSSHFGGNRSANSRPAPYFRGALKHACFRAAGAAALIPSSVRIRFGSSSHSRKAFMTRGVPSLAYVILARHKSPKPSKFNIIERIDFYNKSRSLLMNRSHYIGLRFSCLWILCMSVSRETFGVLIVLLEFYKWQRV